jgi:glutamine amidotransferase
MEQRAMSLIGIVDVGVGNIGSLKSAVDELGFDFCMLDSAAELHKCSSLILPGVGAFSHGMQAIREAELVDPILSHAAAGKPLLGICLGMQLLFSSGDEGGDSASLGLIPGTVRKMERHSSLQIPHVGWNDINFIRKHSIWRGVKPGVDFYFVHGYRVVCDQQFVIGVTAHGEDFPSVVASGNVIGLQFHPEKSQRNGLRMLENFCLLDSQC